MKMNAASLQDKAGWQAASRRPSSGLTAWGDSTLSTTNKKRIQQLLTLCQAPRPAAGCGNASGKWYFGRPGRICPSGCFRQAKNAGILFGPHPSI